MTIRFLLFSGRWENEGNFYLLESEKNILLLATGKDYSLIGSQEQQVGRDYLKENRNKIRAVIIANTNWQNIGLLADIGREVGFQIPIYTSHPSKLILTYLFPRLRNKIIAVETWHFSQKDKELKIGDFSLSFVPLNGYLLGNLGVAVHHFQSSFYFLEGFIFSSLLNNRILFAPNFWPNFQQFCARKRKNTYLITNYWGLHWQNKNSLFFAAKKIPSQEQTLFFIFYDFDWLHILELLELARSWKKQVQILSPEFIPLIKQILGKNSISEVLAKERPPFDGKKGPEKIYLLIGNPENIEQKLLDCLASFSSAQKANFQFVVGIPPVIGGEMRLARIIDYLYTQSEYIINFSKKEYLSLGVSFYDLKLLLQLLQPAGIINLQNSYKNKNFLPHLPGRFLTLNNGCALEFPVHKISPLKTKKTLISLEEILVEQRSNLGQSGLLIILLTAEWGNSLSNGEQETKVPGEATKNKLQLKEVRIESVAISSVLNIPKLITKIKSWWPTKLTSDIQKEDPLKIIKKAVEKRLNGLVRNYLSSEHDLNIEEALVLLFVD
ncbi:MAG: metallo-beta-lactamase [Mycoplasmataceae bacterium RV_VA103A]|nr:MAG: metallo-beta-lactamase [Mycoplasmataceae bacterium RV_VA103A]